MPCFTLELGVFSFEKNENLCQCVGRIKHNNYTRTIKRQINFNGENKAPSLIMLPSINCYRRNIMSTIKKLSLEIYETLCFDFVLISCPWSCLVCHRVYSLYVNNTGNGCHYKRSVFDSPKNALSS